MNQELQYKYMFRFFLLVCALVIGMFGTILNQRVSLDNGGKMPVFYNFDFEDSTHFAFQNYSEIRSGLLVDKYQISNSSYSIGDFFIYFGMLFITISIANLIYFHLNNYSKLKHD